MILKDRVLLSDLPLVLKLEGLQGLLMVSVLTGGLLILLNLMSELVELGLSLGKPVVLRPLLLDVCEQLFLVLNQPLNSVLL